MGTVVVKDIEKGDSVAIGKVNSTIDSWKAQSGQNTINRSNVRTEGPDRRNFRRDCISDPINLEGYQSDVTHYTQGSNSYSIIQNPQWIRIPIDVSEYDYPNEYILIHCSFGFRTESHHNEPSGNNIFNGRFCKFRLIVSDSFTATNYAPLKGTERTITTGVAKSHVTESVGMTHLLTDEDLKNFTSPFPQGRLYVFLCGAEANGSQLNIPSVSLFYRRYKR